MGPFSPAAWIQASSLPPCGTSEKQTSIALPSGLKRRALTRVHLPDRLRITWAPLTMKAARPCGPGTYSLIWYVITVSLTETLRPYRHGISARRPAVMLPWPFQVTVGTSCSAAIAGMWPAVCWRGIRSCRNQYAGSAWQP